MAVGSKPDAALAVGAHPDDIEFMMSGTLMLLGEAGLRLHYMNIASGSCGTATEPHAEIVRRRRTEALEACKLIGATHHESIVDDIEVFHTTEIVRKVAAVVRTVRPRIMLVPSPQDYMEDHVNASRVAVTAAFTRGMLNYPSDPEVEPVADDVTIYHALPYGLRGPLRELIRPGQYVDASPVMAAKRRMLACHRSQKEWLDKSQGVNAYLKTMAGFAAEVGEMSGRFEFAEGWRRRSHLGFSAADDDPLSEILGERCFVDDEYEAALEGP